VPAECCRALNTCTRSVEMTVAGACSRGTMGRGQTPTVGRKVEAGPRVETHDFKLPPILFRSSRENRGPSEAPAPANNASDPAHSRKFAGDGRPMPGSAPHQRIRTEQ
jgi:hypothetical protein